jgi:hypothetical protein
VVNGVRAGLPVAPRYFIHNHAKSRSGYRQSCFQKPKRTSACRTRGPYDVASGSSVALTQQPRSLDE